jgi:hypothetical protein
VVLSAEVVTATKYLANMDGTAIRKFQRVLDAEQATSTVPDPGPEEGSHGDVQAISSGPEDERPTELDGYLISFNPMDSSPYERARERATRAVAFEKFEHKGGGKGEGQGTGKGQESRAYPGRGAGKGAGLIGPPPAPPPKAFVKAPHVKAKATPDLRTAQYLGIPPPPRIETCFGCSNRQEPNLEYCAICNMNRYERGDQGKEQGKGQTTTSSEKAVQTDPLDSCVVEEEGGDRRLVWWPA